MSNSVDRLSLLWPNQLSADRLAVLGGFLA